MTGPVDRFEVEGLEWSLARIAEVFDIQDILDLNHDRQTITDYYHANKPGYRYLHSRGGAVHLAVNPDNVYSRQGFRYQAQCVSCLLDEHGYTDVLELGCCKGYNCMLLARNHPKVRFTGIDIASEYLEEAISGANVHDNCIFLEQDFHSTGFDDSSFDLIFEIESTCYAQDHSRVLREVLRILKPGGRFVAFDFFRAPSYDTCDAALKHACLLVEKSTAIPKGTSINDWLDAAQSIGFEQEQLHDLTQSIMPNLKKFHALSTRYFRIPGLARTLNSLLSFDLVRNNIAGLLMPYTMSLGAQGYYHVVMRRS